MRYIKYVGLSHQRMLTAADWRSIGITGDTVVWNAQNGFAVPLDVLTEDQVRKAIEPDSGFVITGEDEDFTPRSLSYDTVPAEAAAAAESPVDVLAYANGDDNVSTGDSGAAGAPGGDAPVTTGTGGGSTRSSKTSRES